MRKSILFTLCVAFPCLTVLSDEPPRKNAAGKAKEAQRKQQAQVEKPQERQRDEIAKQRERDRELDKAREKQHRERAKSREEALREPDEARADAIRSEEDRRGERKKREVESAREEFRRIAEANARLQEQRLEARERLNDETRRYLEDRGRRDWEENRRRYEERAFRFDTVDEAQELIQSLLGGAVAERIEGEFVPREPRPRRLALEQVGRSDVERQSSVAYLVRRFLGEADYHEAPPAYRDDLYDYDYDDQDFRSTRRDHRIPQYFNGNRRVVYYDSRLAVPPVLLASDRLDRVEVVPYLESPYRLSEVEVSPSYSSSIPAEYRSEDAYAVSYTVEPETKVSRDDILFRQGETGFADAYSYDIVVDLAEAMRSSELQGERFIIEGHASAEGDYGANLRLSQERAERVARDLVEMGVDPDRLIPVGYGEAEARYPADTAEDLRARDRRIMVFTVAE